MVEVKVVLSTQIARDSWHQFIRSHPEWYTDRWDQKAEVKRWTASWVIGCHCHGQDGLGHRQMGQRGSRAFRSVEAKPVLPQDRDMFRNSSSHPHSHMHSASVSTETSSFITPSWVGKWKQDRQLKGTTQSTEDRFRDVVELASLHSAHHKVTSLGDKLLLDAHGGERLFKCQVATCRASEKSLKTKSEKRLCSVEDRFNTWT